MFAMVFLAASGCGSAGVEATDGPTTTAPPSPLLTATEPSSTSVATTESSTAEPTTAIASTTAAVTTITEPALGEEPPLRGEAVSGSGCSPGGDTLPAGWWYGTIESAPDGDI